MYRVKLVLYPLKFENRENLLANELNKITNHGGIISFITSDSEGYTIIYEEHKKSLVE